jgi:methylenetetrahydrofolate--tRNA-(uracil-5-)-methyltransferase
MNVNFGLFPPIAEPTRDADGNRIKGKERGAAKKRALTARALADLEHWLATTHPASEQQGDHQALRKLTA